MNNKHRIVTENYVGFKRNLLRFYFNPISNYFSLIWYKEKSVKP